MLNVFRKMDCCAKNNFFYTMKNGFYFYYVNVYFPDISV